MRKIELEDSFTFSEIADKMGVHTELEQLINELMTAPSGSITQEAFGIKIVSVLFCKMYKAKKEIMSFIASLLEKDVTEVKKMNVKELKKFFTELFNDEDFLAFFK